MRHVAAVVPATKVEPAKSRDEYTGEETVFYCDPPYVGKEEQYLLLDIEHSGVVSALGEQGCDWLVSYAELPGGLDHYPGVGRGEKNLMGNGKSGSAKQTREHLVMNVEQPREALSYGTEWS